MKDAVTGLYNIVCGYKYPPIRPQPGIPSSLLLFLKSAIKPDSLQ